MRNVSSLQTSRAKWCWLVNLLLLLSLVRPVGAILFYSTSDPSFNTTPPGDALTNSGWQFQGRWGDFLGTPISSNCFITAKHVGGSVGDVFHYAGTDYFTLAFYDDAESDLRVWRVCGAFTAFAALYTGGDEKGKDLIAFGRGTQRGEEVRVDSELKGWRWGAGDGVQRWGENRVEDIVDGSAGEGDFLRAAFNADAGTNEAHLSVGDSGGAVFIQESGVWKLAGINYAVDGPYDTNMTGPGFLAAVFDEGGLYVQEDGIWVLRRDLPVDLPGGFYATRISSRVEWISNVLAQAASSAPVVQSASLVTGPFQDVTAAAMDPNARTITLARSAETQFYRLRACAASRITGLRVEGANVVLSYE